MTIKLKIGLWLAIGGLGLSGTFGWTEDGTLIKKITVKGAKRVSASMILHAMKLKVEMPLDPRTVTEDTKAIFAMGEFSDASFSTQEVEGGVELIVAVVEQPVVSKVAFQGTKRDIKDLAEKIPLKEGSTYVSMKLKQSDQVLTEFFKKEGYYGSKVIGAITEKSATEVKVTFIVEEGKKLTVEKIHIVCKAFSPDRIKGEMKTGEPGLIGGGAFDQRVYEEDLKRIVEFCREEGHDKARIVASELKIDEAKQKVTITIHLDEGQMYRVRTVDLLLQEGELEPDTRAKLMEALSTRSGKRFNFKSAEDDRRRIAKYYYDRGFISPTVFPVFGFDDVQGLVDLTLNVVRGREAFIEEVVIQGNLETKDKVIRRELAIKPGDRFDLSKIQRSQENVWNLGFFDEPPRFEPHPGSQDDKLKLLFVVKERRNTGELSLGAGFSVLDGFTGTFSVTKHNFMGNGQRLSGSAEYGGFRRAIDVSFMEPWLMDTNTSFQIGGFYSQRAFFSDYKELTYGFSTRLGHALDASNRWRLWTSYRLNFTDIFDVATTASREIQNSSGQRTVSSVPMELVYDSRDSLFFNTTKGSRHSLGVEVAGLGGNLFFNRFVLDHSLYQETFPQWVIALHTRWGYVTGYGATSNVPFFERFFMGGTDTVRGYAERAIGPQDSSGFALGGRMSVVANLEYRVPVVERVFYLVSFIDVGGLWDRAEDARVSSLLTGAGLGLRVVIPNTTLLIRLDYGFGFDPRLGSTGGRPHFNFGSIF